MADVSDPAIREAVADVRSDFTDTDWVALVYEGKTKLVVGGTGNGGHAELCEFLDDAKVQFCLLRLIDGDQESQRVKFVFITYVGEGVGGMAMGRVGAHTGSVKPLFGQCNTDLRADELKEMSLPIIIKKLKVAGGADYDTGANAKGYKSSAGSIRKKALAAYQEKEKEGNIKGVVYVTSALPSTTPVDLGGRPMVASAADAKKNTKDTILDTAKFKGKGSKGVEGIKAGAVFDDSAVSRPRIGSTARGKRPPPVKKPNASDALKSKPATASKPAAAAKPAVASKKPATASKPKPAASKPKPAPAAKKTKPVAAVKKADPRNVVNDMEERRNSVLNDPIIEDANERARIRAERRKAKREEAAKKAKEEVAALKARLSSSDLPVEASEPEAAEPEAAEPEAAEPEPEAEETPEPEVEEEEQEEVEEEEEAEEEEVEEAAEPEPEAEPEVEETPEEEEPAPEAAKPKKVSLFDDDDDEDDLFKTKPAKKKPAAKKSQLFSDDEEEEEEAAAEPEAPSASDAKITLSFDKLCAYLEHNSCMPGSVTTPEGLQEFIESS